jgi:hypothetical protein
VQPLEDLHAGLLVGAQQQVAARVPAQRLRLQAAEVAGAVQEVGPWQLSQERQRCGRTSEARWMRAMVERLMAAASMRLRPLEALR